MHVDLEVWLNHFDYHATRRCTMPERLPDDLTGYERRLIAESLAALQLRERSAGRCLLRAARAYGRQHGLLRLAKIFAFVVAEERHHSDLLGEFISEHGLKKNKKRRLFSFSSAGFFSARISMLVSADLIRKVVYRALEDATGSRQLQTLCRMLVADELAHVGFESDLLHAMHAEKSPLARAGALLAQRAYFVSAATAAWFTHRKVLKTAGYRIDTFLQACAAQYAFYLEIAPQRDISMVTP